MASSRKVIITCAITGAIHTPSMSPHLPQTAEQIADAAIGAAEAGAAIVHLHARNPKDGLGLRWSFMGPFETIELNAPGGIADYCARYAGSMKRIAGDPATPAVFEPDNVARVTAAWGRTPAPDDILRKSAWRDRRLAALQAHKRAQPKSE